MPVVVMEYTHTPMETLMKESGAKTCAMARAPTHTPRLESRSSYIALAILYAKICEVDLVSELSLVLSLARAISQTDTHV